MTDAAPFNSDLLTLTQWLSPAFPLGSFAYSHALELAISDGSVGDGAQLARWLEDTLRFGAGRMDAGLLVMVLRGAKVDDIADLARALAPTRERWEETFAQGTAFARTVSSMGGEAIPAMALPVAVGVAARRLSLETRDVAALYLHSFTANLVSAAVRFVPLGQTEGQRVLSGLHDVIGAVASGALGATADTLTSAALAADVTAARHEEMPVRIFKT
ncbi:Urease accessory protein UreF [Aquimixticola soesokkakensis]|uniref:Urease accessory protein UreF n=1 Tax=Aquimixticola soesokkakensis TaxID=1519096 RepID=A0A1Y5S1D6_9RHOB|nr:urease accessory UreF family protein [Aquimixticola soesokkakensis]SLN29429.1 Urease accessory protein UreF [Aquimixticola soesokkakensis]